MNNQHQDEYGDSYTTRDVATVFIETTASAGGVAAGVGATGGVAGATAVANLLGAAGISASVPVVGWVIAGGTVLAAAIIATINVMKNRVTRTEQVVQIGQMYGFPQAAMMPGWILDALSWGRSQRMLAGKQIEEKLTKGKGKSWELQAQLSFLGILEVMYMAEQRSRMGLPQFPPSAANILAVQNMALTETQNIRFIYMRKWILVAGIFALSAVGIYAVSAKR